MGDPHERKLGVYLPPNYNAKNSDPYPVLFFLSGWGSRSFKYLNDESVFTRPLYDIFDEDITNKKLPPFIGVFPDGTSRLGCSQYINSPSLGNYQDYIADELVELIDSRFHTHRSENFRGILGHSSGGYGALVAGALRPDRFKFIASSAGDSFFENLFGSLVVPAAVELQKSGGVEKFLSDFFAQPNPGSNSRSKMNALIMLSSAACYAPNPKSGPLYGDLYFDQNTAKIIPEVQQRYLAWDPICLFKKQKSNIAKLKYIYLDAGREDEHGLQYGQRQLAEILKDFGTSFDLEEYPGGHSGQTHRYSLRALKLLSRMVN